MKIQFLLFCFLTVTGFVEIRPQIFTVHMGEDFKSIFKSFTKLQGVILIYLCRMPCVQPMHNLIEVHGRRTKSGRYSLRLENLLEVHLAITQVVKEDTGLYKLGVSAMKLEEEVIFRLIVKDLCDGGVFMDRNQEYRVTEGSNLSVKCYLTLQPRNRKFLCRDQCSAYLIDTNDPKGYSSKYGVEYLSYNSFKVMMYNLSAQDSGRYCCGVGRENSPNFCQEFTVRVNGASQDNPIEEKKRLRDPDLIEEDHEPDFSLMFVNYTEDDYQPDSSPTVPNLTQDYHQSALCAEGTGLALPIVTSVLGGIILILVSLLIHMWKKKTQSPHYMNCSPDMPMSPAERQSQTASCDNNDPVYSSLSPVNRDSEYYPLKHQQTHDYLHVI
ncbi:uncharacterized protein LOC110167648 [Boleophthalmus pectinirostris]|uniref:uncharacterized protein LOC110167648 n=1 Tax=Boleophthalmus pectinirostris TaxID=150288 RepID=UPI002430FCFE|nr:uncharacterized protein LOC110167648 [Boleophthalmus pectinirostris]